MKPKIAFLIYSLSSGGAERVVSALSNSLTDIYDVTIITFYNTEPFYKLSNKITLLSLNDSAQNNLKGLSKLTLHFRNIKSLMFLLKQHKIQLLIGFMPTANIYSVLTCRFLLKSYAIKYIISERIHPDYNTMNAFWYKLRQLTYPYCNALVVQTQAIKDCFIKYVSASKIHIIKNPLSEHLALDKSVTKTPTILNVGRLEYQKNQELLIRTFSKINAPNWKLIIIGNGSLKAKLTKLIEALNINDRVTLIDSTKSISKFYNSSSIFVSTSRFEGFPNALTEAMHFGLPCIATDCPSGPSELIDNSINGFLIPLDNDVELYNKLNTLINDTVLRKTLGKQAQLATQKFSSEIISSQWQQLINSMLK